MNVASSLTLFPNGWLLCSVLVLGTCIQTQSGQCLSAIVVARDHALNSQLHSLSWVLLHQRVMNEHSSGGRYNLCDGDSTCSPACCR